jgi:pimeloyl-ACP methyl ester carboxylesterase
VARVCDEAGVTRAVFCGHGLAVALKVAVHRPDLSAGVVLLDGAVLMPPPVLAKLGQLVQALEPDGWREALLGFIARGAGAAAERVRADIAAAPRLYGRPILRDIIIASCTDAGHCHAGELAALRCPLLYVHSQIPTDLKRLRELDPDIMIEEIPDAGHYQMLTAPKQIYALLDRFLEVIG